MKKTMIMLSAGLFTLAVLAFTTKTMDQKPWPVPDAWKNKANPLKGDAASVATGKTLYNQHCNHAMAVKEKVTGQKQHNLIRRAVISP